jgi:hypothetical protein
VTILRLRIPRPAMHNRSEGGFEMNQRSRLQRFSRLAGVASLLAVLGSLLLAGASWGSGASYYAESSSGKWCYVHSLLTFSNIDATSANITASGGVFCNFVVASINGTTSAVKNGIATLGTSGFGCGGCNAADTSVFVSDRRANVYSSNTHATVVLPPGQLWLYGFPTAQAQASTCTGWGTSTLTCDVKQAAYVG